MPTNISASSDIKALHPNSTKTKLKAGETVFGCFVRYPDPSLIELLGFQGWDFLVLDAEHGTIEPRDCENLVRAAELRSVTPIVRVTTNLQPIILRYLDTGAQGAQVPWINSAEDAERAVQSIKYQPRGIRGLANVRAADYAQTIPFGEYVQQANQETLVVLQVEGLEAIEQLPEIVKVDGVDVIFIGPTDLSQSLGLPGQTQHEKVQEAMRRITDIVLDSDAALGLLVPNAQAARDWMGRGARYIATTIDGLIRSSVRGYLEEVRKR